MEMETETEYCNICGRMCDEVHSINPNKKEKDMQKNIITMLESYNEKVVDEIIAQIYENRRLRNAVS